MSRSYVTTAGDLACLDDDEIREGYFDGFNGEHSPGGNRSLSYSHGWHVGKNDRAGISEGWQFELIASMREAVASL